jgi:hypothetical protein
VRKLLTGDKHVYHMREYAIVENDNGTYEYVAWDSKGGKLSWIRGEARILEDVLALTRITSEGEEETLKTIKEVRKELKKLPDWWGKTKYYCVVLGQFAAPGFRVCVPKVGLNYTTWYDELGWGTEGALRATAVPQQGAEKGRYHECDRQEPTC